MAVKTNCCLITISSFNDKIICTTVHMKQINYGLVTLHHTLPEVLVISLHYSERI